MGGGAEQCRAVSPVERGLERELPIVPADVLDRLTRYSAIRWGGSRLPPGALETYARRTVYQYSERRMAEDHVAFSNWFWLMVPLQLDAVVAQIRLMAVTLEAQYLGSQEELGQSSELTQRLDDLAYGVLILNAHERFVEEAQKTATMASMGTVAAMDSPGFVPPNPLYDDALQVLHERSMDMQSVRSEFLSYHPVYSGIERLMKEGLINRDGLMHTLTGTDMTAVRSSTMFCVRKTIDYFKDGADAMERRIAELRAAGDDANWKPFSELIDTIILTRYYPGSPNESLKHYAAYVKDDRVSDSLADTMGKAAMVIGLILGAAAMATNPVGWLAVLTVLAEGAFAISVLSEVAKEQEKDAPLDRAAVMDKALKATPHSGDLTFDIIITVAGLVFTVASVGRLFKAGRGVRGLPRPGGAGAADDAAKGAQGGGKLDELAPSKPADAPAPPKPSEPTPPPKAADAAPPAKPGDPVPEPPAKAATPPSQQAAPSGDPKLLHEEPSYKAGTRKTIQETAQAEKQAWEEAKKKMGPATTGESTRTPPGVVKRSKADVEAGTAKPKGAHGTGKDVDGPTRRGTKDEDLSAVREQETKRGGGAKHDAEGAPEGTDREVGDDYLQESKTGDATGKDPKTGKTWRGKDVPLANQPYDDSLTVSRPSELLGAAMENASPPRPRPRAENMAGRVPGSTPRVQTNAPSQAYQPHHVVPEGHPDAKEAQKIIREAGIGINDADNGAWLPTSRFPPNPNGAVRHEFTYTKEYIGWLTQELRVAQTRGLVRERLKQIGQGLESEGVTPWPPAK